MSRCWSHQLHQCTGPSCSPNTNRKPTGFLSMPTLRMKLYILWVPLSSQSWMAFRSHLCFNKGSGCAEIHWCEIVSLVTAFWRQLGTWTSVPSARRRYLCPRSQILVGGTWVPLTRPFREMTWVSRMSVADVEPAACGLSVRELACMFMQIWRCKKQSPAVRTHSLNFAKIERLLQWTKHCLAVWCELGWEKFDRSQKHRKGNQNNQKRENEKTRWTISFSVK